MSPKNWSRPPLAEAALTPYATPLQRAVPGHWRASSVLPLAAAALLFATIVFNPALAWVNAHLFPLTASAVSTVQGAIVLFALVVGLLQPVALTARWLLLAWLLVLSILLTSAVRAQFEPKIFGDMLLIPAFILLGMRIDGPLLRRTVLVMQALILIVGLWELARPGQYGAFFNVTSYYVNTRGFDADAFWAGGELFLSSQRPSGRMLLDGFGLHRGSSLFLEPVSLGNWAIMAVIFTVAMWRDLSVVARLFMGISSLLLLVICDGRLALSVVLFFCLWLPFCRWIPDRLSAAYLPLMLIGLWLAGLLGLLSNWGDTFSGRLAVSLKALQSMGLEHLLGVGERRLRLADAGWADFIQAQSLFVALGLWLMLSLTSFGRQPGDRMAKHGIMLFITLCLPVSNSMLSIKTAALLWMLYGFCFARGRLMPREGGSG